MEHTLLILFLQFVSINAFEDKLWSTFKTIDGKSVNRSKLLDNYNSLCLLERYKAGSFSDSVKLKDLKCSCQNSILCHCNSNCCANNSYGYLQFTYNGTPADSFVDVGRRYFLVGKCPYDRIDDMKRKCEDYHVSPVTSSESGLSYRNEHCAYCHGEKNNATDWTLTLMCPKENFGVPNEVKRLSSFCSINYMPPDNTKIFNCPPMSTINSGLISQCNVTGLWKVYDADIDWACRRLNMRFQFFKNVFCFLCNPSLIVETPDKIIPNIDSCASSFTGANEGMNVTYLCNNSTVTQERLFPFRNIYCYLCFKENKESKTDYAAQIFIAENDPSSILIGITLNNTLAQSTIQNFRKLFEDLMAFANNDEFNIWIGPNISNYKTKRSTVMFNQRQIFIDKLVQMCAETGMCKSRTGTPVGSGSRCSLCSCEDNCYLSSWFPCCLDLIMNKQPFSCIEDASLPLVKPGIFVAGKNNSLVHQVIDICHPSFVNITQRQRCVTVDSKDILSLIPVEVSYQGRPIRFRNIYCLLCNNINSEVKVFLRIRCRNILDVQLLPTLDMILNVAFFHECQVSFSLQDLMSREGCGMTIESIYEQNRHFECVGSEELIGYGNEIDKLCSSSMIDVLHEYTSQQTKGLDVDTTAIVQCSNKGGPKNDTEYLCFLEGPPIAADSQQRSGYYLSADGVSYRSLFSISRFEMDRFLVFTESLMKCTNGSIDIKAGQCLPAYCSAARTLDSGECVNIFETIVDQVYALNLYLQTCEDGAFSIWQDALNFSDEQQHTSSEIPRQNLTNGASFRISLELLCWNIREKISSLIGNSTFMGNVRCSVMSNNFIENDKELYHHGTNDTLVITAAKARLLANISIMYSNNRTHLEKILLNFSETFNVVFSSIEGQICSYGDCNTQKFQKSTWNQNMIIVKHTLECPLVELDVSNVTIFNNGKLAFSHLGREIGVSECNVELMENVDELQRIRVCRKTLESVLLSSSVPQNTFGNVQRLESAYFIFSTICNVFSLFGLFFTLFTYVIFKPLRTVPGRNNMNLAFCLFMAQALLQYSYIWKVNVRSIHCRILGIFIHYFWLATFCDLNMCSFHMYSVFCAQLRARANQSIHDTATKKYTAYVYGVPFAVVTIVAMLSYFTSGEIGYGSTRCFLDHLYSVVGAFLVPSCAIFLSNIVFYAMTFYKIYRYPSLRSNIENRNHVWIYIKLSTITGIAWPLVFIDALLPLSIFSFIATFANALQGLFIFLSFVCNKRVARLYSSYVSGETSQPTVSTGRAASTSVTSSYSSK